MAVGLGYRAEIYDAVVDYARSYFELSEALTPETCLVELANRVDSDFFTDFVKDLSRKFEVRWPANQLYVSKLTVEQLCEIVEARQWPEVMDRRP